MKISTIIPTILTNKMVLINLLDLLNKTSIIDEIILINNSEKNFDYKNNKIKLISPKKNLYVNESWNIGIKEAKNDFCMILNDDLVLNETFFSEIEKILENYKGIIGLNESSIVQPNNKLSQNKISLSELINRREYDFWGSCIILHKKDYYEIPRQFKIWFGDDYLIWKNKENNKKVFELHNANIYHIHSSSSANPKFKKLLTRDIKNFLNHNCYEKEPLCSSQERSKWKIYKLAPRAFFL